MFILASQPGELLRDLAMIKYPVRGHIPAVTTSVQQPHFQAGVQTNAAVFVEPMFLAPMIEGRSPPRHVVALTSQKLTKVARAVEPVPRALSDWNWFADRDEPDIHVILPECETKQSIARHKRGDCTR